MTESIIKPKQPTGKGWHQLEKPPAWINGGFAAERWLHLNSSLVVISAVEVAAEPVECPQFHISISKSTSFGPQRCNSSEARFVLQAFGIEEAEEDNHVPNGIVRNFWRPVADNLVGRECSCKDSEPAIKEDKGDYVWRGVTR